jgi:hypothetical protein
MDANRRGRGQPIVSGKPARLELSWERILGFRREAGWLNERLPALNRRLAAGCER